MIDLAPENQPLTKMDAYGDRFARRNGRWVKITKQSDGKGYTVVRGWRGDVKCATMGITRNHRTLQWAKIAADSWLDNK